MPWLFLITSVVGTLLIIVRTLAQVEFWQRKEYRWDRMRSQVWSPENKGLFTPAFLLGMFWLDVGWLIALTGNLNLAEKFGWLSLLCLMAHDVWRTWQRGWYRPIPTLKAILIIVAVGLTLVIYLQFNFEPMYVVALQWATFGIICAALVAAWVGIVNAVTYVRKQQIISQARQLRQQLPQLQVVGITGSYGKTSTKHFLQQLLGSRAQATRDHRNSVVAVAYDMLTQLTHPAPIYLAEMGAYRRGEIKALAALTQSTVGILTVIGNQHLALFGSLAALAEAKWELMAALPPQGTAVLNAADPEQQKRSATLKTKIIWYTSQANPSSEVDVYVRDVTIKATQILATLHIGQTSQVVKLALVSEAMLASCLAAVAGAYALDLPPAEIYQALSHLTSFPRTMQLRTGSTGAIVIDDSYSANEAGVLAALAHLRHFTQASKIVVFTPLIELGAAGPAVHARIATALAASGALVFITNTTYAAELKAPDSASSHFVTTSSPAELLAQLRQRITPESVVLLEGRLPNVVREALLA